jgi:hypothetical protein
MPATSLNSDTRSIRHQAVVRPPDRNRGLIEERAMMVTTFISGLLMTFVNGYQVISDADHLDRLIRQILES